MSEVPAINQKAEKFIQDAEKEMKRFFRSKDDKLNNAADFCVRAGNLYKIDRNFEKAGDCYMKSAAYIEEGGNKNDAANKVRDAILCYFKVESAKEKAIKSMDKMQELLSDSGDPYKIASLLIQSGGIFYKNGAKELAMNSYNKAFELLKDTHDSESTKAKIIEEQAFIISEWDYNNAAKYFFEAAKIRLQTPLTQSSANRLFTYAVFCKLAAQDEVGAKILWDEVADLNPAFKLSYDGKIVDRLVNASTAQPELMKDILAEYDKLHASDAWAIRVFNKINKINEEGGEDEDKELL